MRAGEGQYTRPSSAGFGRCLAAPGATGEDLVVTEHGREVARLVPIGAEAYAELAARLGASVPVETLEAIAARLSAPGAPAGTADAYLADARSERVD